ncbi:MAG: segregation/condensation protein A [Cyanobacteria bacterium P01_H01_bin.15]
MMNATADYAISTLIDLAHRGEIDPWDVQVIDVIDRFLLDIGINHDVSAQESDLPRSGQAFLWAAMLVLLKAQNLEQVQAEADELESDIIESDEPLLDPETLVPLLPPNPEQLLRRRSAAPPPRKRRVTLTELIAQIQQLAAEMEERPKPTPKKKAPRQYSRREAVRHINALAHNENLTETALQLEAFLANHVSQLSPVMTIEELVTLWRSRPQITEIHSAKSDRVGVFWALLLLSSQSKVELEQQEFYQDLTIRSLARQELAS